MGDNYQEKGIKDCYDFYLETAIEIRDSVRGKDVFIVQTGSG